MSNINSITENFIDIISLKNQMIAAYPNCLILGMPKRTLNGLKFDMCTYFKIRICDI